MKKWETKSGYVIYQILNRRCNIYLIKNNDKYLLVDSGVKSNRNKLDKNLSLLGIDKIDYLFLTHTHYDHTQNANYIKNKYGAKIIVNELEADFLKVGDTPLPKGSIVITKIIISLLGSTAQKILTYEACESDININNDFDLSELGFNAHLLTTPGHTLGSMSAIIDDEIAIVGDTLIGAYGSIFPFYADDIKSMINSWKTLINTDCKLFLPAHGKSVSKELLIKNYNKRNSD